MKNKIIKVLSYILYTLAIMLFIAFAVLCAVSYFHWKELMQNPLVDLAPFSTVVKLLCRRFLVPSVVCAVLGYVLQRISKR